ncbi:prepilin-type N-terminal cleavage/methylation domain-containing protein [Allorhodopirellula solitaria]|nr:prepilin-type N-terminal cleavage/methylation domain-containing protein [Allorhodopirellula solitaria]
MTQPNRKPSRVPHGFTLVEMLIVMVIFLMLVAVALPVVKGLISDQKATRTAQNIEAFMDAARSRAIAEGRTVGVRFERLSSVANGNYARSTSLRLRQLVGVPAYTGDAANAVATLSGSPANTANFDTADSPLIYLSSQILNDTVTPSNDYLAPIQVGDMLELPGGRSVPITGIGAVAGSTVPVTFDLAENTAVGATGSTVNRFPQAGGTSATGGNVKYRIQRSPAASTSRVMSLPRGMAIDFNYSGIGVGGSQFAPSMDPATLPRAVDILFNASGAVSQVIYNSVNTRVFPTGLIYFCVGEIDGVASVEGAAAADRDNLFSQDSTLTTNIMDPDSLWVVVNPASGRVTTVSMATPGTIPADPTDPTTLAYGEALKPARVFATFSDTVAE